MSPGQFVTNVMCSSTVVSQVNPPWLFVAIVLVPTVLCSCRLDNCLRKSVVVLSMSTLSQSCLQWVGSPAARSGLKLRASTGNAQPSKKKSQKTNRSGRTDNQGSAVNEARLILERKRRQEGSSSPSGDRISNVRLSEFEIPDLEEKISSDVGPLDDQVFESRLQAVRRSIAEQRRQEQEVKFGPIDYERPVATSDSSPSSSLALKVGVGIAVVVFGIFFAIGDFLPIVRPTTDNAAPSTKPQLTSQESARLQVEVQSLEAKLKDLPEDKSALQGVSETYAQLGEYEKAIRTLESLSKLEPENVEVWRLLGESQSAVGDYKSSAAAFSVGIDLQSKVSPSQSFALLQGLTDALIFDNKANEAVSQLLKVKAKLESNAKAPVPTISTESASDGGDISLQADIVDVELLLGKAYAAWGHTGDAVAVYEGLIAEHPEDFRGYLAKAILLKERGKLGEAERMFIQARYWAPSEAKGLVERYASRGA